MLRVKEQRNMGENQNRKDQDSGKPFDKKAALEELIKAKASGNKTFGKGSKNSGFGSHGGKSSNSAGKGTIKKHRSSSI